MPISDVVRITIRRVRTAVSRVGFGTALALDAHRLWEDRYRRYGSLAELEDDGAVGTDTVHRAATSYFGQSPAPRYLAVGRRATGDNVTVSVDEVTRSATYGLTIGGLLHTITSPPDATAAQIAGALVRQINGGYEITGSDDTTDYLQIAGDHVDEFPAGSTFRVYGGGNAGSYTVISAALNAGNTRITVAVVPVSSGEGHIDGYAIVGASTGSDYLEVTGDVRSRFPAGLAFTVVGSTGNDGNYIVGSTELSSGNTRIFPTTAVANATADGGIRSHADGESATDDVTADISSGNVVLSPGTAAEFYSVKLEDSKLRLSFTTSQDSSEDLTDVRDWNDDWYGIGLTVRDVDEVLDLAASIEAIRRLFGTASGDTDIIDTTDDDDDPITGSVSARLKGLSYSRTWSLYSGYNAGDASAENDEDPFAEFAWFGKMLATDPGRSTWNLQTLAGIVADELTSTQRTNALAKNANIYVEITDEESGTQSGTVAEPEWIDVIVGLDWLHVRLEERIFGVLKGASDAGSKIPYTKQGIAVIEAEVKAQLQDAVIQGVLAADPAPETTVPDIADISSADKAARILRNVKGFGTLAGAIHEAEVEISVGV